MTKRLLTLPRGNSFESFELYLPEPVEDSASTAVSTLNASESVCSFSSLDCSVTAAERLAMRKQHRRRRSSMSSNRWESGKSVDKWAAVEPSRRRSSIAMLQEQCPTVPRRKLSAPDLLGLDDVSEESLDHVPLSVTASPSSGSCDMPVPPRRKESSNDLMGMSMDSDDEEDSEEEDEDNPFNFQHFLYQGQNDEMPTKNHSYPQETVGNATRALLAAKTPKDLAPSTHTHTLSPPPSSRKVLSSANHPQRWA